MAPQLSDNNTKFTLNKARSNLGESPEGASMHILRSSSPKQEAQVCGICGCKATHGVKYAYLRFDGWQPTFVCEICVWNYEYMYFPFVPISPQGIPFNPQQSLERWITCKV